MKPAKGKLLNVVDAAYLAGLIDGEGYVGVSGSKNNKASKGCKRGVALRISVSVNMTDSRPLKWAQTVTGVGTIHTHKKHKAHYRQAWNWQIWSREAALVLKQIRPFLKVKGKQADLCIEYQSQMRFPGTAGLKDSEWEFRLSCWDKSKELNHAPSIGSIS
jgi:LAGLIDADG endonuclease